MATAERKNMKAHYNIDTVILTQLNNIIRINNPYAEAYKMMYEVEKEKIERCSRIVT